MWAPKERPAGNWKRRSRAAAEHVFEVPDCMSQGVWRAGDFGCVGARVKSARRGRAPESFKMAD
eukprot:5801096-Pyramimonas_sp.AAC.1